jgi:hypothetical protein
MIFAYLAVFIVALILANIFIIVAKPKKRASAAEAEASLEAGNGGSAYVEHPEVITALQDMDEKHSLVQGSLQATNQKLGILNGRLTEVERAVSGIIETRMGGSEGASKQEDADYEKIDFRISVLEDEIDRLKSPKHAPKTFYGRVDPDTEKEIKALVFNSKKA